jgi:hypothetical protein
MISVINIILDAHNIEDKPLESTDRLVLLGKILPMLSRGSIFYTILFNKCISNPNKCDDCCFPINMLISVCKAFIEIYFLTHNSPFLSY